MQTETVVPKKRFFVDENNEVPVTFFLKGVRIQFKIQLRDIVKYGMISCIKRIKMRHGFSDNVPAHIYYDNENPTLCLKQYIKIDDNIKRTIKLPRRTN